MKRIIFNAVCFLALSFSAFAQGNDVIITASSVTVEEGQEISVDVLVENWTSVASAQWSMHWDDEVLEYSSISNFSLPGIAEASFGTPPSTDDNTLTFSWFDEQVQGVSLADESVLFTINFMAIGSEGMETSIMFDGMPTVVEIVNPALEELGVQFGTGTVTVDDTNATGTIYAKDFALHPNSPNPFKTQTNISLDLNEKSDVELNIYTVTGKLVYSQKYVLPQGANSIPLSGEILPSTGTYIYSISTDEGTATRKMTLID